MYSFVRLKPVSGYASLLACFFASLFRYLSESCAVSAFRPGQRDTLFHLVLVRELAMTVHVEDGEGSDLVAQEMPLMQQDVVPSRNGLKLNNTGSWSRSYEEFISTWTLWGVRKSRKSGNEMNYKGSGKVHFGVDDVSLYGTPKEEPGPGLPGQEVKQSFLKNQLQALFQPTDNKLAMKLFGSKKALMKERIRQKAAGHWVIHPCSSFRLGQRSSNMPARKRYSKERTARIPAVVERTQALISDNSKQSLQKISIDCWCKSTMRRITEENLRYKSYTLKIRQMLFEAARTSQVAHLGSHSGLSTAQI
ncbi:Potassium/sodium hyperpolarization-activated cyclic nucleotide-gated channel 2 [Atta colombica]|uniref:Potassium/sodium hyperpolarization-activated cyclic nucleotide-gated channel 2 n=1 Tax=Atta colombica TaxID=520822 RepID=A0A195BRD4_9HYME|nr:Potassium/sodium hyperpolarization-activated cyclic nucleotide-gated channel 2 [Atta colombica]